MSRKPSKILRRPTKRPPRLNGALFGLNRRIPVLKIDPSQDILSLTDQQMMRLMSAGALTDAAMCSLASIVQKYCFDLLAPFPLFPRRV